MPSAGFIKAAPSCCHRNGMARPLASRPQAAQIIDTRGGSTAVGQLDSYEQVEYMSADQEGA